MFCFIFNGLLNNLFLSVLLLTLWYYIYHIWLTCAPADCVSLTHCPATGAFCQEMRFLDILVVLSLDLGQISFNLVENAFSTRQLALVAIRIAFYHISARAWAETESFWWTKRWPTSLGFSIFEYYFPFPFSPFLFFSVIDLPLGLLGVTTEQLGVVALRKFCSEFFTYLF